MSHLVLDTSVWINLLATENAASIIAATNHICLVTPQVHKEVARDPVTGSPYQSRSHPLTRFSGVKAIELSDLEAEIFLDLVSGTSSARIGDGEASAIAVAAERRILLAMDERKGRRIAKDRFPSIALVSSYEILTSEKVVRAIGQDAASACVSKAFQFGGMHRVA